MSDDPAGSGAAARATASRARSRLSRRAGTPSPGNAAVEAGNGQGGVSSDSETTANLPQIGGPADPYLDREHRASRGSSAAPAVGHPAPANQSSAGPQAPPVNHASPANQSSAGPQAPPRPSAGSLATPPPAPVATPPPPFGSASARPPAPSAVEQYAALGLGHPPPATSTGATAVTALVGPSGAAGGGAPIGAPVPSGAASVASPGRRPRRERTPRRARLQIRHFNVWTVFKFSVVLAVALFFVWLIIVAVLYGTLDHLQAIDHINKTVRTIENDSSTKDAVTPKIVFTSAFLIGLLDIVLFIALTTIGAVVYNLCADLVGGIEVTLAERD